MYVESEFPRHLLKKSPEARKEYFRKFVVNHKKIEGAAAELLQLIYEPANAEVINVVGPTGVGKSTLIEYVIKKIYERELPQMHNDVGWIPAILITAQNPETGSYDWKEHYIDSMVELKEVLINHKIELQEHGLEREELRAFIRERRGTRSALRRAAQSAFKNRHPLVCFVDEAQYMTKRKSGEGLNNQADTIRSFAYLCRTLHALIGTYDLLGLRNLNGQLGRRSHTVHFNRYTTEVAGDAEAFAEAYSALLSQMPLSKPPKLSELHLEFCFLRCLGCVGLLKNWLMRSLAAAIEDKRDTVDYKLFKRTATPNSVVKQIADEIERGETLLKEEEDDATDAYLRLKLGVSEIIVTTTKNKEGKTPENQATPTPEQEGEATESVQENSSELTVVAVEDKKESTKKSSKRKATKSQSKGKKQKRGRRRIECAPRHYKVGPEETVEEDAA